MLVVKRLDGSILYEGIDEADCKHNYPFNEEKHILIEYERYDDYLSLLQDQYENQVQY